MGWKVVDEKTSVPIKLVWFALFVATPVTFWFSRLENKVNANSLAVSQFMQRDAQVANDINEIKRHLAVIEYELKRIRR